MLNKVRFVVQKFLKNISYSFNLHNISTYQKAIFNHDNN